MEWKDLQPILTLLAAITSAIISAFALLKTQDKKRNDDIDLRSFDHSLDKKLKEFESILIKNNSYLSEKGIGAATKEDIEEITHKIETVRVGFLTSLEVAKSELSRKANLHKIQAEKEFYVYSMIWDTAIDVRDAVQDLRPIIQFGVKFSETTEEKQTRWNEKFVRVNEARNKLISTVDRQRPFYPNELYQQLMIVISDTFKEILDSEHSINPDSLRMSSEGYQRSQENIGQIITGLNKVLDLMRSRISES